MTSCAKCSIKCDYNDEIVSCSGICSVMYHSKCLSLSRTVSQAIASQKCLRWYCDSCSNLNIISVAGRLDGITSQMTKFSETLEMITSNLIQLSGDIKELKTHPSAFISETSIPIVNKDVSEPIVRRSKRIQLKTLITPIEVTPSSSTATVQGIEDNKQHNRLTPDVCVNRLTVASADDDSMTSVRTTAEPLNEPLLDASDEFNIRVVQPRRWLFVSRLHYSVSDVQFKKLLSKIVNTDDVYATQRITPKSYNGMRYDYISYKINIPGEVFDSVIESKLWPRGLLVKEFERCQKQPFFQKLGPHRPPR